MFLSVIAVQYTVMDKIMVGAITACGKRLYENAEKIIYCLTLISAIGTVMLPKWPPCSPWETEAVKARFPFQGTDFSA